jgi:hypothetical protein
MVLPATQAESVQEGTVPPVIPTQSQTEALIAPYGPFGVVILLGFILMFLVPSVRSFEVLFTMAATVYFSYRRGFDPWFWLFAGGIVGLVCLLILPDASAPGITQADAQRRRQRGAVVGGILSGLAGVGIVFVIVLALGGIRF